MMRRHFRYVFLCFLLASFLVARAQTIQSLIPATVTAGAASFALNVTGSNFAYGDTAYLDGSERPTIDSSDSLLRVLIYNTDVAKAGKHTIVVKSASGATSNTVTFQVTGSSQPPPPPPPPPPPTKKVTVTISAPTASQVACSPLTLVASAVTGNAGAAITRWEVLNNAGTVVYSASTATSSIRPQLKLAAGTQTLKVEAWDSTNLSGTASVTFSVSTASPPCAAKTSSGPVASWHGCMRNSGGHDYQAMEISMREGATEPFNATLYTGTGCNPNNWLDQIGFGTPVSLGGFNYSFWFIHHPDLPNSSVLWTIGNQNSGCVNYNTVPQC
jgi:hypothetical protein